MVFGHVTLNGGLAGRRVRAVVTFHRTGDSMSSQVTVEVALHSGLVGALRAPVQTFVRLVRCLVNAVLDLLCGRRGHGVTREVKWRSKGGQGEAAIAPGESARVSLWTRWSSEGKGGAKGGGEGWGQVEGPEVELWDARYGEAITREIKIRS